MLNYESIYIIRKLLCLEKLFFDFFYKWNNNRNPLRYLLIGTAKFIENNKNEKN